MSEGQPRHVQQSKERGLCKTLEGLVLQLRVVPREAGHPNSRLSSRGASQPAGQQAGGLRNRYMHACMHAFIHGEKESCRHREIEIEK